MTERNDAASVSQETAIETTTNGSMFSSTREARFKIYSCVFCEFIRENLSEIEQGETIEVNPDAFEGKYLYHMMSVHGLRR